MYAMNVSTDDLNKALKKVNEKYDNNIIFNRLEYVTKNKILFTLRVENSRGYGARRSGSGRRTVSACWHVHGLFFDTLLQINKNAVIISSMQKEKIFVDSYGYIRNNWKDFKAGNYHNSVKASELCDCKYVRPTVKVD